MGFFSLKTRSKKMQFGDKSGHPKPSLKIKTSRTAVIPSIAPSTPPSSPQALQPSNPSIFHRSINSPLTPPPTPITTLTTTPTSEQQNIRLRSASAPEVHSKTFAKTFAKQRSSSFLSTAKPKTESHRNPFSSTLFQTPAQRKRREKREGKLPAILSYNETPLPSDNETEPTNSSYASLDNEDICDPSSSTTYTLPEKTSRRQTDNRGTPTNLRPTMLQMTL